VKARQEAEAKAKADAEAKAKVDAEAKAKADAEASAQQRAAGVAKYFADVDADLAKDPDRYELILHEKAFEDVHALISAVADATGKLPDVKACADKVEEYLLEQTKTRLALKKLQAKPADAKAPEQVKAPEPAKAAAPGVPEAPKEHPLAASLNVSKLSTEPRPRITNALTAKVSNGTMVRPVARTEAQKVARALARLKGEPLPPD